MDNMVFSDSSTFFSCRLSEYGAVVVWKAKHFSTMKRKVKSPKFPFETGDWCLELYPDGNNHPEDWGYVGLFLKPSSKVPLKLCYRFSLKDDLGRDINMLNVIERDFSDGVGFGYSQFLKRKDLLGGKLTNLVLWDILTVCCTLKLAESSKADPFKGVTAAIPEPFVLNLKRDSFATNFREVFQNGNFSDVVLRVGNETISAHKVVLSAQSSVFKAMFDSNMKECRENIVDLVDMDVSVGKAMLRYMYTREVDVLPAEKTLELYVAADKYMLYELQAECRKFITIHLSPETVGEVFEIARLHSDNILVDCALKFFADNVKSILQTKEWECFSKEKSASSVQLLSFAVTSNVFF